MHTNTQAAFMALVMNFQRESFLSICHEHNKSHIPHPVMQYVSDSEHDKTEEQNEK